MKEICVILCSKGLYIGKFVPRYLERWVLYEEVLEPSVMLDISLLKREIVSWMHWYQVKVLQYISQSCHSSLRLGCSALPLIGGGHTASHAVERKSVRHVLMVVPEHKKARVGMGLGLDIKRERFSPMLCSLASFLFSLVRYLYRSVFSKHDLSG